MGKTLLNLWMLQVSKEYHLEWRIKDQRDVEKLARKAGINAMIFGRCKYQVLDFSYSIKKTTCL